jgi:hypothetical protein
VRGSPVRERHAIRRLVVHVVHALDELPVIFWGRERRGPERVRRHGERGSVVHRRAELKVLGHVVLVLKVEDGLREHVHAQDLLPHQVVLHAVRVVGAVLRTAHTHTRTHARTIKSARAPKMRAVSLR